MREYIILSIDGSITTFNYRSISNDEKAFVNKNSFYKDSLYYSLKYFKKHKDKIIEKLKEKENLDTLKVQRLITFKYALILVEELKLVNLKLNFLSTIAVEDYDLFLNSKYLKNIECYFMASNIKEKFNKKGINVIMHSNKKITNNFLNQQDVTVEDTLYYKKVICLKEDYPEIIDDLSEFLKVNYKLKAIHLYIYSKDLIESIVNLVKNDESRNVIIFLHQENDKGNFITSNFEWLKNISNKCKEDYTCEFRIIYSNAFLKNNLFKQLTFNNLKLISILCIYVSVVCILIIKSYEYVEKLSIDVLNNDLINESYALPNEDEESGEETEISDEDLDNEPEITKEEAKKKYNFEKSFESLKKINKETVGYLIVNNTEINYPIVQHSDNSYYLKRDFYKKKTSMGWVYMDYRNHKDMSDVNTIMYGHSMLNGTMFGTLKKVLNSSWRKEENNMIITYETEGKTYKYKIFSAYKVDYTTDYLKTNFDTKEDFNAFIKLIKGRSSFKSKVNVRYGDKILTLSTCAKGDNRRLAVHAVLLED